MKKIITYIAVCISLSGWCNAALGEEVFKGFPPARDMLIEHINDVVEHINLMEKWGSNPNDHGLEYHLKECSKRGNYLCTGSLGELYYKKKEYSMAQPVLLNASTYWDGAHDYYLGLMYHNGEGVLANTEKAIYYYKKAARSTLSLGDVNKNAAYNLAVIYQSNLKSEDVFYYSGRVNAAMKSKEKKQNLIKCYAWLKISQTLGETTYLANGEENLPLSKLIQEQKDILSAQSLLEDGEKLAVEICSGIKKCIQ